MVNYGLIVGIALQILGLGVNFGKYSKTKGKKWTDYSSAIVATGMTVVLYFWIAGWTIY